MTMNEELLKKISELIEKIDCLAGKALDVKRQECAHGFEPTCSKSLIYFDPCVLTEKDWRSCIKGWQHGRCKFCGIKMTAYQDELHHLYHSEDSLEKCRKVLGWPEPGFHGLAFDGNKKLCKVL